MGQKQPSCEFKLLVAHFRFRHSSHHPAPCSRIELWPWFVLERAARTQIKTVWRLAPWLRLRLRLPLLLLLRLLLPEWRDNQRRRAIFNTFRQDTFNILYCCVRTSQPPRPLPSRRAFYCANVLAAVFALFPTSFLAFFRFFFSLFVCFIELSALSLVCARKSERQIDRVSERAREMGTGTGKSAESNNLLSNSR